MMGRIACLCLMLLAAFSSCHQPAASPYTEAPEGYAYRLITIGDGKQSARGAEILLAQVLLRTGGDSVFFNSRYLSPGGFLIHLRQGGKASGKSYLSGLAEGDSVSLKVGKTCFFRDYFDTLVPPFLAQDSVISMNLKVTGIRRHPQAPATSADHTDLELQELQEIDRYLRKHYPRVNADGEGLYTLEHQRKNTEAVAAGKRVRIAYSGYYLNGAPIDNGQQQLEFSYGAPDQLVRGLNIVIGRLKKGETTKIIVPSRLAFGETGSTNGSIPPYTPLLYNLTLIDIK